MHVRKALIACWSNLANDPRIQREITWLTDAGWQVDTLGEGQHPHPGVREHFRMTETPVWMSDKLRLGLALAFLPYRRRFDAIIGARFPAEATRRAREGHYDLIVSNDIDFLPWAVAAGSTAAGARTHHHLDLHEYHIPRPLPGTSARLLVTGYYRWTRTLVASPVFRSRTTVAPGIAALYAREFAIEEPAIVRNCPDYVEQSARPVDPERIELIYHGSAVWERGLRLLVDAVPLLEPRYRLNLMLTGSTQAVAELRQRSAELPDRIRMVDPVPMAEVAHRLNDFDLEIMLYPPTDPNLEFALPNKLFEAVQGRLGLVSGHSPSMQQTIEHYGNGMIVDGWDASALAATLNAVEGEAIDAAKRASEDAARDLNAEHEGRAFLRVIEGVR